MALGCWKRCAPHVKDTDAVDSGRLAKRFRVQRHLHGCSHEGLCGRNGQIPLRPHHQPLVHYRTDLRAAVVRLRRHKSRGVEHDPELRR